MNGMPSICIETSRQSLIRFTLIELLLVVSIITLLLSLLLPAFSNAKSMAKRSCCVSNLRQIGMAMRMYWDESGEWVTEANWFAWGGFDSGSLNGTPIQARMLSNSGLVRGGYICPDDNRRNAVGGVSSKGVWKSWGTSYALCSSLLGMKNFSLRLKENSKNILIGDTTIYVFDAAQGWPGTGGFYSWHSNAGYKSNALFLDMHCGFINIPSYSSTPDYNWTPK